MCSLNQKVSPNCSPGNLKQRSDFTERELFLIQNRSGFTVETLCTNHEKKYLTFYVLKQTTCCDPLNKHCDEKKVNSLRVISFEYEKDFNSLYPRILEGNKICCSCRKIVGQKETDSTTRSEDTASTSRAEETVSPNSTEEIASTSDPMPRQSQSFAAVIESVDIDGLIATQSQSHEEELERSLSGMSLQPQKSGLTNESDSYTDPLILIDKINDSLKTLDLEKVSITKLKSSKFRLKLLHNIENKFKALFKKLLELDESESSQDQGNQF